MLDYQMQTFVTVAEKKNFSRAAEALNLTQPAISLQVQTLEEQYGVRLFERSNKKVELTQAGQLLLEYAQKILRLHREAEQALNDLMGLVTGKLLIGASLTIGEYVLPRLLASYTDTYPNVELSVSIGNTELIADRLLSHDIDVGLVEGTVVHKQIEVIPFLEDEMVLIVPPKHPLASMQVVGIKDVAKETFIIRETGSGTRHIAEELLKELHIHPPRTIEFGSTQGIKEAVEAGLGIAIISKWCIRKEVQLGMLRSLSIEGHSLKRAFSLLWMKDSFHARSANEFVEFTKKGTFLCE